jgi:polar amino acid transport system permease protein
MDLDFQFGILRENADALALAAGVTLWTSAASFVLALAVGVLAGAGQAECPRLRPLLAFYVDLFRGTPLLIQLFFIYYGLPSLGVDLPRYAAALLGLGLNGGAYVAEIVRGALLSVPPGQEEAARVLGLSRIQTLRRVILPQATRVALPPLMNAFSSTLKDSSLLSVLAITEITRMGQLIYTRTFRAFEVYLAVGLVYYALTRIASTLSKRLERRMAL